VPWREDCRVREGNGRAGRTGPAAVLAAVLAAALCALLAACGDSKGPVVLEWAEAGYADVSRILEANGVVRVRDGGLVAVGSRLKGQVMHMYVRTGDIVRKGQLLAVLDDRELMTQRDAASARLESALNEQARLGATRDKLLEQARAALAVDVSKQDYASKSLERRRTLREKGHIAQGDLDASLRDDKAAAQAVAGDKAALQRVSRENELNLAAAAKAVEAARAEVAQVDAYLSMTRVESPIDGIVGQVHTQEGEQVVAEVEAVKIVTVIDPRLLELWVYVNEADAAGVHPGVPVRFFKSQDPATVMGAVVERVSPSPVMVDRVQYFPAVAPLAATAATLLRPEMNVVCYVMTAKADGVLSVPNKAVFRQGGRQVVYEDDGHGGVKTVTPRFGLKGAERTQVLSGLKPGSRVAVKLAGKEAS